MMEGLARLQRALTDAPESAGDAVTSQARGSCRPGERLWLCSPAWRGVRGFDGGAELSLSRGTAALSLPLPCGSAHRSQTALPPTHALGLAETAPKPRAPARMGGFGAVVARSPRLRAQL